MAHYIENTGATPPKCLEVSNTKRFSDVSLRRWLAFTPFDLVPANLKIEKSVVEQTPPRMTSVIPA
jgi:oxalate decarboxylase/phosphoglucose isomerase-like protein (cupin superfamily)